MTGAEPPLAARDPSFRLERSDIGAPAACVLDLGDGSAWRAARGARLWGAASGRRVVLGAEPAPAGPAADPAARALLETLAAGEALRLVLGLAPHAYDFTL